MFGVPTTFGSHCNLGTKQTLALAIKLSKNPTCNSKQNLSSYKKPLIRNWTSPLVNGLGGQLKPKKLYPSCKFMINIPLESLGCWLVEGGNLDD